MKPPSQFESWEQARDFYALEATFLGQLLYRHKTAASRKRYKAAAARAMTANQRCEKPYPEDAAWEGK